jgi:hypothetical protein
MEKSEEILGIAKLLYHNHLTIETATKLLVNLIDTPKDTNNLIEVINNIPKQEQAQYSLNQQLNELGVVANRLGLYDASDFIEKTLTK